MQKKTKTRHNAIKMRLTKTIKKGKKRNRRKYGEKKELKTGQKNKVPIKKYDKKRRKIVTNNYTKEEDCKKKRHKK